MRVLSVFVSPCVLTPLPSEDRRGNSAVEYDVGNSFLAVRLCKLSNLICKIWHDLGL